MNYHLMIDEKFIDGFIESAEVVAPGKNIYVFDVPTPGKFVSYAGINGRADDSMVAKLVDDIRENDRVYVHWFNEFAYSFVSKLKSKVPVYLFFWGGDFLSQTKELFDFNLDKLSRKYYRRNEKKLIAYLPLNPFFYLKNVKRYWWKQAEKNQEMRWESEMRKRFLNRLNFFCHWNKRDLRIVTEAYGGRPEFRDFFYPVHLDKTQTRKAVGDNDQLSSLNIWLGNSDTITNNHLDALNCLKKFNASPINLFCPLNYERDDYSIHVEEKGREYFSSNWHPITRFMPVADYMKLQESIDIVIMFHNRTQAAGNIFAFLKMGKKVYLKSQSTIFSLLKKEGIEIFDSNEIEKISFEKLSEPLTNDQIEANIEKISKLFSEERRMSFMNEILN